MNNLLSNRYINTVLAYLSALIVFVLAVTIAGSVGTLIMSALVFFISGGLALWTLQWFDSKLVVKNVSKIEEE